MSEFEDRPHKNSQTKRQLQLQRHQATTLSAGSSTQHPLTPLMEATEAEEAAEDDSAAGIALVSRKSIMGRVKLRVSNILPTWFSPTSKAASEAQEEQQQQQQQQNGTETGATSLTRRKRRRRCIELAEPDGEDSPAGGLLPDVDDGAAARGLDYEEVALADNIAEHDLVAEDEQTRRSEYNVFPLRKRRAAIIAADDDFDDDDDDVADGDEDDEEEDEDDGPADASVSVPTKRRRIELETSVNLPSMRRMPLPLVSSTPAAAAAASGGQQFTSGNSQAVGGTRSRSRGLDPSGVAPHRRTHLNLYHQQRQQREPGYNFFAGNETAAEATTGDLPVSIRRSLNIPVIDSPRGRSFSFGQTQTAVPLANHKRPSLLVGQAATGRDTSIDAAQSENERIERLLNICKSNNNISNNNNNIIKSKRGAATTTAATGDLESELHEYPEVVETADSYPYCHNSNSNLSFYGNLQSAKSIFNSTCSLNALNRRKRFNASIYGSSSALSDSRLLTRSASASACGSGSTTISPFYKGQTTFGGNSAHNRIFGQGAGSGGGAGGSSSSLAMNSGGSSPAAHQAASGKTAYGMKPLAMRPSQLTESQPTTSAVDSIALSSTTSRILSLLESYSTPLIDVKRLGNTLKEQQKQQQQANSNQRLQRGSSNPNHFISHTEQLQQQSTPQSLLAPTMQHVLEKRRLHRVSKNWKKLVTPKVPKAPSSGGSTTMALAALPARQSPNNSHTNKMRSRLSHQSARKEPREDTELAPEPLDLPIINFPAMANTPTFDLVIKPPPPSTPATLPSVAANTTEDLQIRPKPQPAFPMPAVNFVGATATAAPTTTATATTIANFSGSGSVSVSSGLLTGGASGVSERSYSFGEPIPIRGETASAADQLRSTRNFSFPAPSTLERQQQSLPIMNGPSTVAAAHNPSSSNPVEGGFSQQFRKSATEWECDVCMIRNRSELVKCAACETPKPSKATQADAAATPTSTPTAVPFSVASSGFGDRFKKSSSAWECDTCMVSNKNENSKCVACETPRQGAAAAASKTTTDCFSITNSPGGGFGSGSGSGFSTSSSSSGFGQAFRPKANTWECQTCLVMNQTSAVECVACQSRNPSAASSESSSSSSTSNPPTNVSSSTSSTINTSFKFGFTPEQQKQQQQQLAGVKQDVGFQNLVAAQKAANWECETCMAMNDQALSKCCCCEQLRPGSDDNCKSSFNATHPVPTFTFGFVPKAKETAPVQPVLPVMPVLPAAVLSTSNAAPQFSFGFGQSKDVADSNNASMGGFKFGAPAPDPAPAATVTASQEEPKSIDLRATMPTATKATSTTGIETAAAATASQFSFRAPTTTSTVLSSSSDTSIPAATAAAAPGVSATTTVTSQGFSFGTPSALPSSSSAVSSSTHTSGSNSSVTSVISSNVKPMFSFSAPATTPSGVSSSTTVTTASVGFFGSATTTSTSFAATPAPAPALAAAAPAPAVGLFSFGSLSSASSTTKAAPSSNTNAFFFGQTPTSTAAPSSSATGFIFGAAVTSVASGNNNSTSISFSSSTTTTTAALASAAAPTPVTFGFGEKRAASGAPANSLTKPVSFGWPSASASAGSIPSNGSVAPTTATDSSTNTNTSLPTVVSGSSVFGSGFGTGFGSTTAASTPAPTAAASSAFGGNGALPTTGFGFVGNSMAPQSSPAPASGGQASIFNNAITPVFGGSNGGGGGGFGSTGTAAKPAFNFGGPPALSQSTTTSAPGPFNFGGGGGGDTGGKETSSKLAFNFTGSVSVSAAAATPQATPAFNFSAGSATANSLASGDLQSTSSWQRRPEFTDGAPQDSHPCAPFAATVEVASQASETTSTEAAAAVPAIAVGGGLVYNHMIKEHEQPQAQRMGLQLEDIRQTGQVPQEDDEFEAEEELVTDNESSDIPFEASSVGPHRRSPHLHDRTQQQFPHVSKYRFVRSVTDTTSTCASTAGTATIPDGETTTPMLNTAAAKLTRQKRFGVLHSKRNTRSRVNTIMSNRSHRGGGIKRISYRQRYNDIEGAGTGTGTGTGVGSVSVPHVLRSRYKLVRRRSNNEAIAPLTETQQP
ncbi:nuclear pore complex protein Nup153 isoform X3 [Drosophila guanche]|uniref:nuclear pore complex protein Nup153 isoform X3 n=1 Tax=Drosophila guanche TaxID=7266 RepID=UPI0014726B9B|nr:nuclear pore complex protein Nup153 isoform X3 [Drosophila guanche]